MTFCRTSLLRTLAVTALTLSTVTAKQTIDSTAGGAERSAGGFQHKSPPIEDDARAKYDPRTGADVQNRDPPIVIEGRDDGSVSCGGSSMYHQMPWYELLICLGVNTICCT